MKRQYKVPALVSQKSEMEQKDNHASIAPEKIERLRQIHLKRTGELLSVQEATEMGIRITGLLRLIYRPIPVEHESI